MHIGLVSFLIVIDYLAYFNPLINDAGKTQPLLTNEQLIESLEHTNSYCLQGIQSNQKTGSDPNVQEMRVEELPGLEPVVSVLEEVLMWPSMVSWRTPSS